MGHWTEFLDSEGHDGAYLPWKKVEPRVGISRTTAWRLQKAGEFPKPYVVSAGRVAYRESEVEAWKASRSHRSAATGGLKLAPTKAAERMPIAPAPPSWTPAAPAQSFALDPPRKERPRLTRLAAPAARTRRKPPKTDQMSFDF